MPTKQAKVNPSYVPSRNNHRNSAIVNRMYASMPFGKPALYISALDSIKTASTINESVAFSRLPTAGFDLEGFSSRDSCSSPIVRWKVPRSTGNLNS